MLPVFAVYSTFLQRSYDQLLHDCAIQNLHVVLGIDRAGLVGEDGETHQGVFDVSMLNSIPNTTVFSPCYFDELQLSIKSALYDCDGLVAVRYPRGCQDYRPKDLQNTSNNFDIYGNKKAKKLIITYGRTFSYCVLAKEKLQKENIDICILKLCRIKPIDQQAILFALNFDEIYFFEEGILTGGIALTMENNLKELGYSGEFYINAIDNKFVQQASVVQSLNELCLDASGIYKIIKEQCKNNNN